jgi:secondary thiamine-phosphate synthase enzyme
VRLSKFLEKNPKRRLTMITLTIRSNQREEMIDVTDRIQDAISVMDFEDGICTIYCPHTTSGLTINEGADPMVCKDILDHLSKLVPQRGNYRHIEGNSDAHIKVAALGSSQAVLVNGGRLCLGTWQRIFFCEFDGPRTRNLWIQALGTK